MEVDSALSDRQVEQLVDELNLAPNICPAHPPNLPLPHHVDRFITLDRSPRRLKLSKSLLGVHAPFDRSVILLDDVVQVLNGSAPAAAAERPFLLNSCDRRAIDRRQIRIDDARLRVRSIAQALPNNRLASSASRNADSRKSMVSPAESIARQVAPAP